MPSALTLFTPIAPRLRTWLTPAPGSTFSFFLFPRSCPVRLYIFWAPIIAAKTLNCLLFPFFLYIVQGGSLQSLGIWQHVHTKTLFWLDLQIFIFVLSFKCIFTHRTKLYTVSGKIQLQLCKTFWLGLVLFLQQFIVKKHSPPDQQTVCTQLQVVILCF